MFTYRRRISVKISHVPNAVWCVVVVEARSIFDKFSIYQNQKVRQYGKFVKFFFAEHILNSAMALVMTIILRNDVVASTVDILKPRIVSKRFPILSIVLLSRCDQLHSMTIKRHPYLLGSEISGTTNFLNLKILPFSDN